MTTIRRVSPSALAIALLMVCGTAQAAFVNFNTVTANNTVGTLTNTYNFGPITATAAQVGAGTPKTLTVANFSYATNTPNEVGLGVCSSGDTGSLCTSPPATVKVNQASSLWDGQVTEIDNLGNMDRLNLSVNAGNQFNGQFILGSFDSNGGTSNYEDGFVMYGSNVVSFTRTGTGASITSGNATITQATPADGYGADVFFLTLTNFDPTITQVSFGAGCAPGNATLCGGTNNDYLVAAAGYTAVPLPAGLWLLVSGLAGFAGLIRRRVPASGLLAA